MGSKNINTYGSYLEEYKQIYNQVSEGIPKEKIVEAIELIIRATTELDKLMKEINKGFVKVGESLKQSTQLFEGNDLIPVTKKEEIAEFLKVHKDFVAEKKKIDDGYNKYIQMLEKNRKDELAKPEVDQSKVDAIDADIRRYTEKRKHAIKKVRNEELTELTQNSEFFTRLFEETSKLTQTRLKELIKYGRGVMDFLSGKTTVVPEGMNEQVLTDLKNNEEAVIKIYDNLKKKESEFSGNKANYPFAGFVIGMKDMRIAADYTKEALKKTGDEQAKLLNTAGTYKDKALKNFATGAVQASEAITYLSTTFKSFADLTKDEDLKETSEQLSAVAQNLSAAAKGMQSGGWVGAIIGGGTDMITQTVNSILTSKAEDEKRKQERLDFLRAYNLELLKIDNKDHTSVFGSTSIDKAREASEKAKKALKNYNDELSKTSKVTKKKEFNSLGIGIFGMGVAGSLNFFGFGKSISNETKTLMAAYEKGYTDLQAMAIKTKNHSGWSNFWGKKDKYTSLKDLAPELWDEDTGEFNVTAAEKFLATNTQINEEQKKQVQNVIDLQKAYEENLKIIDEQIKANFGTLTADLTDAIFNSVRNGADAWALFEDAGIKVIDALGKQLVQEMYIQAYLDQFQERMRGAYEKSSAAQTQKELANIMKDIYGGLGEVLEGASQALVDWDNMAIQSGFDMNKLKEKNQGANTGKAFANMSQDQGNRLEGLFTSVQTRVSNIDEKIDKVPAHINTILGNLNNIEKNTSYCRFLEDISIDINEMKRDGLKIK